MQEPRAFAATAAGVDCSRDARGVTSSARDRVFAVPGRCADGAAHARAKRGGHVRVPARACDLERVGDCRGHGRGVRRAGSCADVALFVCSGRARGCDAIVEHSSATERM